MMVKALTRGIFRYSPWDGLLIAFATLYGCVLLLAPAAPVVALGVWWGSNTISHNFIHKPFFRDRRLNALFSLYLTVLLGVPLSIWRDWHLAHHASTAPRVRWTHLAFIEASLVVVLLIGLLWLSPTFFFGVYLPGYLAGLVLCALHGRYEHVGGTTSYYGELYNLFFFNDGYHWEHHASPGTHWTHVREHREAGTRQSRWPPVLRWLDAFTIESMERLVLHSKLLQRLVIQKHERALRSLLPALRGIRRVAIVGGGLFPRTALILARQIPRADITIIDASAENLRIAEAFLDGAARLVHDWYDPGRYSGFDLVVIPLSYVGDREVIYAHPPGRAVLVHDWIWRARGTSAIVSLSLLKRLNLVTPLGEPSYRDPVGSMELGAAKWPVTECLSQNGLDSVPPRGETASH